jgi:hypothetical protein
MTIMCWCGIWLGSGSLTCWSPTAAGFGGVTPVCSHSDGGSAALGKPKQPRRKMLLGRAHEIRWRSLPRRCGRFGRVIAEEWISRGQSQGCCLTTLQCVAGILRSVLYRTTPASASHRTQGQIYVSMRLPLLYSAHTCTGTCTCSVHRLYRYMYRTRRRSNNSEMHHDVVISGVHVHRATHANHIYYCQAKESRY